MARGLEFVPEFFADLDYSDDGNLMITREHQAVSPVVAASRCLRAVSDGLVASVNGVDIAVQVETICIHSDTPGAVDIAESVHKALQPHLISSMERSCYA